MAPRGRYGPRPLRARLRQHSSDGRLWYRTNAARKMSYVPFPFPHAQFTAMSEIASLFVIPPHA